MDFASVLLFVQIISVLALLGFNGWALVLRRPAEGLEFWRLLVGGCCRMSGVMAALCWRRFPNVSSPGASLLATLAGCFESWRFLLATCAEGLESWPLPVADRTSAEGFESWRPLVGDCCRMSRVWRLPVGDACRMSRILALPVGDVY